MHLTAGPSDLFQLISNDASSLQDMCRTYGRITVALRLFRVSGLLVGLDWLLMNLAGYPLLFKTQGDDSFYSRVTLYTMEGKGRGREIGGEREKGREGEGKGMGPSYVGTTAEYVGMTAEKTFVCVLIIAKLQTCLATTHKQKVC